MPTIYLDNHASTRTEPVVIESMREVMLGSFGNPHSDDHYAGWAACKYIETARRQISDMIGADSDELIFTSGATESNNLAIIGYALGSQTYTDRNHIIVSAIEHKCVLGAAKYLEQEGWRLSILPCDAYGMVDLQTLAEIISSKTALVSIMAVNNEIGTIQPLRDVAEICNRVGAVFHCDSAQAPLAIELDVQEQRIDMLSLSAHKMHGPRGIGALYIRRDLFPHLTPIMHGGGQERGLRPGTLATPLCVGFGQAAETITATFVQESLKVDTLRKRLLSEIRASNSNCILNGSEDVRHPGNLNITFPGIDANRLIGKLQPYLAISNGSACTTGIPEPSHVLTAIGLSLDAAESTIRIGIDKFTTLNEIDTAATMINQAIEECSLTEA